MIKRGDKGTVNGNPARVIAIDIKGQHPLAIEVEGEHGWVDIVLRWSDGTANNLPPFIPAKPWDSLKPGDACFVRNDENLAWQASVFAGFSWKMPTTFNQAHGEHISWSYCVPAKLIDGELVPVEEE